MDSESNVQLTTSERIARIISLLTISPFQVVVYLAFADVICSNLLEEMLLNTISGTFYLVIPFLPLIYITRKKRIKNASIPREDRFLLLLIQIIGFIGASLVYYFYPVWTGLNTEILLIFTIGYTILNAICLIITIGLKYKISLHMTGAASSITALVMVFGWQWGFLYLFCIPIGWARLKLHAHTRSQVISGTILGIIVILLTFTSFGF